MLSLEEGVLPSESEQPDLQEQYHDYLITSLRTSSGANISYMEGRFGKEIRSHFENKAKKFTEEGSMYSEDGHWIIDPGHWIRADYLIRELFLK